MKITKWDAQAAEDIGHAFGYYDYGQETGMGVFYSSKEAVANYIAGYVRMAFEGQMLYATSERGVYRLYPARTENKSQGGHGYPQSSVSQHEPQRDDPHGKSSVQGRQISSGSNEEREERFYIRRYGLRPRTIPGTGIHEESSGHGLL